MSYNNLFGNPSHPRVNIHNNAVKANLGTKLNNVRDRQHTQQEIPIFDAGNSVSYQPVSTFGASLLDTTSLADLRTQILENTSEEAIRLLADGNNEINFYTGGTGASNLKLQVKNSSVDLVNNTPLNVNDLNVGLNKSLIADYVGSRAGENLRLRRGGSVYQEYTATGINVNENVVIADNKHLKQKIEDNDNRVLLESVAKRQYCLYSYEAGTNSGLLIQADGDIIKLNNYKNTAASYQPISVNSTALSYFVCGAVSNPTGTSANFVSNGISLFSNGATPLMLINSSNIKPYVDIIPDGPNAYDLGNAANYFGNLHVNSVNVKNDIFIDFFNSTDIKNDGFYFRNGFGSGSGFQDNMSIRGHNNSGANDGIAISAYGGVSINCGAISASNDNGTDAATNRVMLLGVTINNHRNMLPYIDGGTDLGSVSNKFNEIYGNNIRAHTSLYTDSIRPYSSSPVHFHNTSITTDNGYSLAVDRVQSTASNRDLFLGNDSLTKMVLKNGASGNVELVAPAIVPPTDTTNSIGTGAFRFGSINGMIVSAWTKVNTELIQHLGSGIIELDGASIRPNTNATQNLGDATKRWAEVYATNGTINTSDRNSKKDIQLIKNALQFVRKLQPVQYKWIENSHGRTHTGFIAQDVLSANPLGLADNWAGYVDTGNGLGLRYSEFISVNTQAIKELDEKLKILAIRVNNSDGDIKVDLNYHTDSSEILERLEALEIYNRLEQNGTIVEEYDDTELKEEIKNLKIENKKQEDCISQLIADNMILTDKLNMLMERLDKFVEDKPNVKLEVVEEDQLLSENGADHMEQIEERLHSVEQKVNKLSNKQAKLITAVNKLKK